MNRTTLTVFALGLGLSACSSNPRSQFTTYDDPEPPPVELPTVGDVPHPALPWVDRQKELLVTDRAILAGPRSDGTRAEAPWSFRHLIEALAPPGQAPALVHAWLASWKSESTAAAQGSLALGVRPDVRTDLVCPWLRLTPANECNDTCSQCTSEVLDLARAPFRLLAIVNRLDLAESQVGCNDDAAEARFVFIALRPQDSSPLSFNAIFEYGANKTEAGEPKAWHSLGSLSGEPYGAALERITRSFTDATLPTLKQIRTSENLGTARGTAWELRQFELADAKLVPTALTNTVRDSMDGTRELSDHIEAHFPDIPSGDNAITTELRTAVSTMPRADFRWTAPVPSSSTSMLDLFGLSTCNGCHAGHRGDTAVLPFSHIGSNERGETVLSRFLDNPDNRHRDELAFRERSLGRRLQGQCGSHDASYGGRRGGDGKRLDRPAGLGRVLARVH